LGQLLREMGGFRKRKAALRIALVYPNVYAIGMANLGLHTVYSLFNGFEGVACERFFLGMTTSLESNTPLSDFDVVGFSLQYEMDYLNIPAILGRSGIEPLRERRKRPLVIAGGPCAVNPLPLTKFVDLFIVGDLEPLAGDLIRGLIRGAAPEDMASGDGIFSSALSNPTKAARAGDLDSIPAPVNQPVPLTMAFRPALGTTFMVEISRGCNMLCRFCMYSHCTLPKRERSLHRIREIVDEGLRITGLRKVSLIGALVTDHSQIKGILSYLAEKGVSVSLPSIRTNDVDDDLLELVQRVGVRTLTIAPEGSPRVRDILKKNLSEEGIRYVVESAPLHGVKRLKLYFIVGVPGEREDDLDYIVDLARDAAHSYGGRKWVTVSINPLIPKPHTPTEGMPLADLKALKEKYKYLRDRLGGLVSLNLHSARESAIQAYLALGNRRTGDVIFKVSGGSGGFGSWRRAAEEAGDPLNRVFSDTEERPWRIVDAGISREYLKRQRESMIAKGEDAFL